MDKESVVGHIQPTIHHHQGRVSDSESQWTSVTRGVTQGAVLEPLLFNVFINDVDEGLSASSADLQVAPS